MSQSSDTVRARAVQDLDVSADGTALLVSHAGGRVLVYDLARVLCGAGPAAASQGEGSKEQQQIQSALGCIVAIPASAHAWGDAQTRALTGASPDRPMISAYTESVFRYDSLVGHARSSGRCRARFSRCGRFVLGGSGDGMAYVWELPRRPHERWRGCIGGADLEPQWVLRGDGVEDSPSEVAWGGVAPGGEVSSSTRLALGGTDGIVRVWRPQLPLHAAPGASTGRCSLGAVDGADAERPRRFDGGRFVTGNGEECYEAVRYTAQPSRHRPHGELWSRVVASRARELSAARPVAASGPSRWTIRSEAIAPAGSAGAPPLSTEDDAAGGVREPPALVRQRSALLCVPHDYASTQSLSDAATYAASPTARAATPAAELLARAYALAVEDAPELLPARGSRGDFRLAVRDDDRDLGGGLGAAVGAREDEDGREVHASAQQQAGGCTRGATGATAADVRSSGRSPR